MWYALQTIIVGTIAYVWLSQISDEKDVGHALFLGVIVAFYTTFILSGILNATLRLIRALRSMLLRGGQPALRTHKKPDKLIHVSRSGSPRPPRLIGQIRLGRGTRDRT